MIQWLRGTETYNQIIVGGSLEMKDTRSEVLGKLKKYKSYSTSIYFVNFYW